MSDLKRTPRILLLSLYYPPDLSAGAFRAEALGRALLKHKHCELDVLTAMPSRYASWKPACAAEEQKEQLRIRRVALPRLGRGLIGQALAMLWFMLRVRMLVRGRQYDVVVATSSRLLTGTLGGWIARALRIPLYLDLRDIFVENLTSVLPGPCWRPVLRALAGLEHWTVRHASAVNLVSEGFAGYFGPRYPDRQFSYYSNGIDSLFMQGPASAAVTCPCDKAPLPLQILYAGNIGDGQALHQIVPELALRLGDRAQFRIIGAGSRLPALRERLRTLGVTTVELLPPMQRTALLAHYQAADVLFLHLADVAAFRRVLPSKLFEYAASGKPILAGVAGYAAGFVQQEIEHAAVFAPLDVEQALMELERLPLAPAARSTFAQRYSRERIMQAMTADILGLCR